MKTFKITRNNRTFKVKANDCVSALQKVIAKDATRWLITNNSDCNPRYENGLYTMSVYNSHRASVDILHDKLDKRGVQWSIPAPERYNRVPDRIVISCKTKEELYDMVGYINSNLPRGSWKILDYY